MKVNYFFVFCLFFTLNISSIILKAEENKSTEVHVDTKSETIRSKISVQDNAQFDFYFEPHHQALMALVFKIFSNELTTDDNKNEIEKIVLLVKDKLKLDPISIEVKTFAEFLDYQKNIPLLSEVDLNQVSIEQLLELSQRKYFFSKNSTVNSQIQSYNLKRETYIRSLLSAGGKSIFKAAYGFYKSDSSIENLRDELGRVFHEKVDEGLKDLAQSDSVEIKILVKLLKKYFQKLPLSEKAEILYQISHKNISINKMDLFLALIQNSGPQLQKIIQIKGRDPAIPEKFKAVFQKLESDVQSVSWFNVKKHLDENGIELNDFIYFEKKPIGVGTMAQTHRVQYLDQNGKRVSAVFRFLKPGIKRKLDIDHQILKKIMSEFDRDPELKKYDLPSLEDLVDDVHNSVVEELDFTKTVEAQNKARQAYRKKKIVLVDDFKFDIQINVPWVNLYKNNKNMTQELVFGRKPEKEYLQYKEQFPELYAKVSELVTEAWLEEVFFGSGFFHADLHQGNMLMHVADPQVTVSLLDFGMTGQLNRELQYNALMLGFALKIKDISLMAEKFFGLSQIKKNKITQEELYEKMEEQFKLNASKKVNWDLTLWTAFVLKEGLVLDYEFIKLNRAMSALKGLLADSGSHQNFDSLAELIAQRHKLDLFKMLKSEKLLNRDVLKEMYKYNKERKSFKIKEKGILRCESLFIW